jgi:hypothetical protein
MGSRKKAKAKKTTARKAQPPKKLLRTKFMADFHARFIFDRTKSDDARILWPPAGFNMPQAFQDIADVMEVLGACMAGQPPAAATANPPTFRDDVGTFLSTRNWPQGSPVPPEYRNSRESTVHLVEMAVICDRMLEALNRGRGGGGGSSWPPHSP